MDLKFLRVTAWLALFVPLFLAAGHIAYAQSASDYDNAFGITVALSSTASDQTNPIVRVPVNAQNLVNTGLLNADGQDLLVLQSGSELPPFVHIESTNPSSWWVPFTGTVSANQSLTATAYLTQNTTAADNPQMLVLGSSSTTEDVAITGVSSISTHPTVTLDNLLVKSWPTSASAALDNLSGGGMRVTLGTTGKLHVRFNTTSKTICSISSNLTLNTNYDIEASYDATRDPECRLVINGTPTTVNVAGSPALQALDTTRNLGGAAGFHAFLSGWKFEVAGGTEYDITFQPAHTTETQAGSAGNLWTYIGTIQDQSASNNDATYTFVRDMSIWTVTVGQVESLATYAASSANESFVGFAETSTATDPFGTSFVDGGTYGFPFTIFEGMVGGVDQMPDVMFSGIMVLLLALPTMFAVYKGVRTWGFAILATVGVASFVVIQTPIPDGMIFLFLIGAVISIFTFPEPWEAR